MSHKNYLPARFPSLLNRLNSHLFVFTKFVNIYGLKGVSARQQQNPVLLHVYLVFLLYLLPCYDLATASYILCSSPGTSRRGKHTYLKTNCGGWGGRIIFFLHTPTFCSARLAIFHVFFVSYTVEH